MPKKPVKTQMEEMSKHFESFAKKNKLRPVTEKQFEKVVKKAAGK